MYLRYSSRVVAPKQCNSPRARAGFNILPASMAPSPLPAPTMVWISSIKRMTLPSCLLNSRSTLLRRSSNSPRYFAPAIRLPMSRESTCLPSKPSGTSPLIMRCARPSTIAVLPTPGSPIITGLFLVRRCNTCIARRISSSRPITGSNLPAAANSVRLIVNLSNAWRSSSAPWLLTWSPPRSLSMAWVNLAVFTPAFANKPPTPFLSCTKAKMSCSLETNWSPNLPAVFSAWLNKRDKPLPKWTSPLSLATFAILFKRLLNWVCNIGMSAPAWTNKDCADPPCCCSKALSMCSGSINWWSKVKAKDWASPIAACKRLVSFSKRIIQPQ